MNSTAEFEEAMLQIGEQHRREQLKKCKMEQAKSLIRFFNDIEEEEPSLTMESEDSSLITDVSSSCGENDHEVRCTITEQNIQKRCIKFNDQVEVREYAITVGEHPMCDDALPMQLDWHYAEAIYRHIDCSKNRGLFYQCPPRLSLAARWERLKEVSNFTDAALAEIVHGAEDEVPFSRACQSGIGSIIQMFTRYSWIQYLAADPSNADFAEEVQKEEVEEDFFAHDESEEDEQPPKVIQWNNNKSLRRLNSFGV